MTVALTFVIYGGRGVVYGLDRLISAKLFNVPDAVAEVLKFPFPVTQAVELFTDRIWQSNLFHFRENV